MLKTSLPYLNETYFSRQKVIQALGYSGLLPFILASIFTYSQNTDIAVIAFKTLHIYSVAIFLFLCGSWWGMALIRHHKVMAMASNAFFLLALGSYLTLDQALSLFVMPLFFILLFWLESYISLFKNQPEYYSQLRFTLTVIVCVSLWASHSPFEFR